MRLTNKLLVLVISMILLILLGSYIFQSKLVSTYLEKSQLEWVHTLSYSLSESVAKDTINGDKVNVQELLQRIVKDDAIEYAYVTDMNNQLFTHSFAGGFPRFLAERIAEHPENITEAHIDIKYNTNKGIVTEFDSPLVKGLSARIHIGVNQLEILNLINRVTKDLIWLVVILGIVSISLTIYIGRKISLPLADFTDKLLSLSYNNKQPFPKVKTSDPDIKKLVHAFEKVIGEREHAEQILEKTQERLLLHRELSPIGIIEWDTDFTYVDWNPAAEEIFGFTKEEVIGRHISENILPESAREQIDKVWEALISNTGGTHSINENITKAGKTILCEWNNTPLVDQSGKIIGITSYVHDITHQKQQEDALRRTQKMDALGNLTGGISHDFNNMLGVILGYAEILKMELSKQPILSNYVDEIVHASERGVKLTRKLLSFSTQKSVEPIQFNINSLLQDNKDMLEKTLTARVKLEYELADNLWPISVDVNDFEDMILNMSINAKHAMNGDGNIFFTTQNEHLSAVDADRVGVSAGDYVRFTVTDSGKGMDEITCDHIFEPFFSTKGTDGTGLGLSQVYGFITRSHGAIKVYSEIGHGTQFDVYLPRSADPGVDSRHAVTETPDDNLLRGTETLLVVDDEKPLREIISVIFQEQGYSVLLAENGKHALEILEKETVDLVISDIIMPEFDGYQLANKILTLYPNIRIQLVSGFNDSRHSEHVSEALQQKLIYKPINSRVLLKRIRKLLDGE